MSTLFRNCPLCEAENFRELYVTRDRHYGIRGSYRLVRCVSCSLVFLNPMYSDHELAGLYPGDYYAYQDKFQTNHWKERLKRLLGFSIGTKDPHFDTPGRILDLGCGSGWFLDAMRERGWIAYGVEISNQAAMLGQQSKGLNIFCGTLREANFPAEFFDYVRSNHSFEHMSCPQESLDEIYRILKLDGKLFIGVPNVDSLNAKLFKQYWWYLGVPVHPFTYSVKTLSQMLAKHNFQIEKVSYNSDYSGLLGSAQIWLNRDNGRKSSEGALFKNRGLKLACHWVAKFVDLLGLGDSIEIIARRAL